MKILLFGKNGFIGETIADIFSKHNTTVLAPTQKQCNLLDLHSVQTYIRRHMPDIIINAAFIGVNSNVAYSSEYLLSNIAMVSNIIAAAREVPHLKKIIHFGSSLEYGNSKKLMTEEQLIEPMNVYGTAKAMTTLLALARAREESVPLIVVRPFNLYGPHDTKSVVHHVIKNIHAKKAFKITQGEQIRDYLYCPDLAEITYAIVNKIDKIPNYEVFNICSGKPTKLHELFDTIFALSNYVYANDYHEYLPNEYWHQTGSNKKLMKYITYPKLTPFKKGLAQTIKWIQSQRGS